MLRVLKKKRVRAGLGLLFALVFAAGAVAYFTTAGSGTGTASVGTTTSTPLTIHGSSATTLLPGVSSTVTFKVDNPSAGYEQLGTIHLASVNACVGANSWWNGSGCSNGGSEAFGCETVETVSPDTNTADFYMPDVQANQDIASGTNQPVTKTGTLTMNDLTTSQDACKNANLTLNFTS